MQNIIITNKFNKIIIIKHKCQQNIGPDKINASSTKDRHQQNMWADKS
jgi:hypothetical protein